MRGKEVTDDNVSIKSTSSDTSTDQAADKDRPAEAELRVRSESLSAKGVALPLSPVSQNDAAVSSPAIVESTESANTPTSAASVGGIKKIRNLFFSKGKKSETAATMKSSESLGSLKQDGRKSKSKSKGGEKSSQKSTGASKSNGEPGLDKLR